MAQDAPPRQELPIIGDPQPRSQPDARPRLVPLLGPRRQSTTITVSLRAVTVLLVLPAIAAAFAESALRSPVSAQLIRWYTSSLLLLCAIGLAVIVKGQRHEHHRQLFGVLAVLGLSFFAATPRDLWPRFAALLASLQHYPFLTLVMGATVACSVLAIEARRRERITFAPALIISLVALLAELLSGTRTPEYPLTPLLRSIANLGQMLGPVLAVRALLQHLSPSDRPTALRFVLVPAHDPR